jgi:hypothetical protein
MVVGGISIRDLALLKAYLALWRFAGNAASKTSDFAVR